jgi:HSP20 family protein
MRHHQHQGAAMNILTKHDQQDRSPALWDPFAIFSDMRRQMDELMNATFGGGRRGGGFGSWQPATEISEDERQFTVAVELPGMEEKDVTVEVDGNVLTLRGERESSRTSGGGEDERKGNRQLSSERWYGSFVRSLTLPSHVDAEHITARMEKGLLTVSVPKRQQDPPKRIPVASGGHLAGGAGGGTGNSGGNSGGRSAGYTGTAAADTNAGDNGGDAEDDEEVGSGSAGRANRADRDETAH